MKNIFIKFSFLLTLCLYSCNSSSQTIINMSGDNITYQHGYLGTGQYYIKDVNNYLNNFVGTWEYINANEKFQIILSKVTNFHQIDTDLNLNYYEDGIELQYRKYTNNILTFESPSYDDPNFRTIDGIKLVGAFLDYGRITKTIYYPIINTIQRQGGNPTYPDCYIEKVTSNPLQIKFRLVLNQVFPNYDTETYAGQPTFSIPNDIIMSKVN